MKSLKESIISNTKIGIASLIENWFKSVRDDLPFKVDNINGEWFIIVDDFASQPRQVSININDKRLSTMPKELCGIYKTYYETKNSNGELRPFKLNFEYIKNKTIDFSHWDMSLGKIDTLDTHIDFAHLNNVAIKGLPKYDKLTNICFEDVNNDMISVKGDYSFTTGMFGYLNINKIKGCDIYSLYINSNSLLVSMTAPANKTVTEILGKKILLYTEYNDIIDNLVKNNKIKKLFYTTFGDKNINIQAGTYLMSKENNRWELKTIC